VFPLKIRKYFGSGLAGIGAGAVNGLFGAGGGMVLVQLLTWLTKLDDEEIFPASVSIILPICLVSLSLTFKSAAIPWDTAVPYLIGSAVGGILAGILGKRIPTVWLHRTLGILIIWGGVRYLC
jgi:uncharacterized membrane protein YfcA